MDNNNTPRTCSSPTTTGQTWRPQAEVLRRDWDDGSGQCYIIHPSIVIPPSRSFVCRRFPVTTETPFKNMGYNFKYCAARVQARERADRAAGTPAERVELIPIHERLVTIRRQFVALAAKEGPHKAELKPLQEELCKIDSKHVDGTCLNPGGIVPASQTVCSSLLEECFDIAQEIMAYEDSKNVARALKPIHETLVLIHRWSLRETDLWNHLSALQEIDKMRVDASSSMRRAGGRPGSMCVRRCCRGAD
ncbi:hypothetical protein DFH09DRAFT_31030 [Mycena vulgaris]|nr:hypothetical protein DFH09DRAFT_31030 [Mycena vulgaris]